MTGGSCEKLVVVLGPADPVLESTLVFVGLHVVHTAGDVTVWAPLEWNLSWPVPRPEWDEGRLFDDWSFPWAVADHPGDMQMEVNRG